MRLHPERKQKSEEAVTSMAQDSDNKRVGSGVEAGMAATVLDFDVLCATVATQTHGKWRAFEDCDVNDGGDGGGSGGVLRMWEGEILDDCFQDRRIAVESLCCPCYRFGKNMGRAGFGSCFIQGAAYFVFATMMVFNWIAFIVSQRHCFLYMAVVFTISVATYMGFSRTQIRRKFNVMGGDSSLDDCVYHLICPCCTLCQESRTLEINNVQEGMWHGRGDTICIGRRKAFFELNPPPPIASGIPSPSNIEIGTLHMDHSWTSNFEQSEPLFQTLEL